jgi:hypothetical protein
MRDVDEIKRLRVTGSGWEMRLGDCVEEIPQFGAMVDYIIFSPPFSSLYTYSDSPHDMGNCRTDEEFIDHFKFLAACLMTIIKPGRLVSVHCMDLPSTLCHNGYIGLRDFPGKVTMAMQSAGFIYHSKVTIWKDPVVAMQRTKAKGLLYKQLRKDASWSRQGIPDEVRTFRAPGENAEPITNDAASFPLAADKAADQGLDTRFTWQNYASPVWMDINPSNTLQRTSARDHNDERHICPLQLEVIERCIRLWSNEGDLVLSPFAGIGSEGHQAIKMGRRFIGVELKESYFRQAVKNLEAAYARTQDGTLWGGEDE